MGWEIETSVGPIPAPWDGRDAVGWVWEIRSGEETRRVVVEVSGTAMAVAEDHLPTETRLARLSSGRSEIEKILDDDDPPRRISLGTTGYLASSQSSQPDFLIRDTHGRFIAAVEVRSAETLTPALAATVRDRIAPPGELTDLRFVLVVSQQKAYLYDRDSGDYGPVGELQMFDVFRSLYPNTSPRQQLRSSELELLVQIWLRDLLSGAVRRGRPAEDVLEECGFLDVVVGGQLEVQPS